MTRSTCWICGAQTRSFWHNDAFDAVACTSCRHVHAEHHVSEALKTGDYHASYDQNEFVKSLGVTRRRQAGQVLDALEIEGPVRSLFDFGCGRGFLLDVAKGRPIANLAGGDVSDMALEMLEASGIRGLKLDAVDPLGKFELGDLGFVPEVVTFLDVIEHFDGNLTEKFLPWLRRLPDAVRLLVFKVPIREGLSFSLAAAARHLGVSSLGKQLFQVGTYPPHYQYFSRGSLARFLSNLGLKTLTVLDDLDFEPELLGARLTATMPSLRLAAPLAGPVLSKLANAFARADSRIVIAERLPSHRN
jgi:hypothetical protein